MPPNCILHKYMFSDIIPYRTMSKVLRGFDVSHAFRLHEGLPVMHGGLSVMCNDCNHDSHINAMMS